MVGEKEGLTLEVPGGYLSKDANTLGRQASRLFKKAQQDEGIRTDIQNLRTSLNEMSYCPAWPQYDPNTLTLSIGLVIWYL